MFGQYFPVVFPVFFVAMWLVVSTILGFASGWFRLMQAYPDRSEIARLKLSGLSGSMGGVSMRSILSISVCPSGLRFGMMRLFGPFSRDFFIPWEAMQVTRGERFFWKFAKILLGQPRLGTVSVSAEIADQLARASNGRWPEHGPFPIETRSTALERIVKQWLISTAFAATFFTVVPKVMAGGGGPPISIAILFPAIVFGVAAVFKYLSRPRE